MSGPSTSPQIAVLPDHIIDQIAAGEVIERPASVVKELVDNALDAGARAITVETKRGGRELIRVVDDGHGMAASDVRLALKRHATSKLRDLDDLVALATLGFRGEALPTIASVSRLTIVSRRGHDAGGTSLTVAAGQPGEPTAVGAPVGTTVEVRDLLANVPARLKFLKGEATEASHISDVVMRAALGNPHVHMRLLQNGRPVLDVPPHQGLIARARALWAGKLRAAAIEAHGSESGITVEALLAAPTFAQGTSRAVELLVDRRPIRDRNLLHAVCMAYGDLLPRGRYPQAVVYLHLPPGSVDYNVHPQKAEVRFSDLSLVTAAVRHVLRAALARATWGRLDEEIGAGASHAVMRAVFPAQEPAVVRYQAGDAPLLDAPPEVEAPSLAQASPFAERYAKSLAQAEPAQIAWAFTPATRMALARGTDAAAIMPQPQAVDVEDPDTAGASFVSALPPTARLASAGDKATEAVAWQYVATWRDAYWLCDVGGDLVVVAAREARALVRRTALAQALSAGALASQALLVPVQVAVSEVALAHLEKYAATWQRLGFALAPFGPTTVAVSAMPIRLSTDGVARVVRALLEAGDIGEAALQALAITRIIDAGCDALESAHEVLRELRSLDVEGLIKRKLAVRLDGRELRRRLGGA